MIAWTCIIAGGADDGRVVRGWFPCGRPERFSIQDSTGAACEAVLVSFDQEFSYALFRHETASPGQLTRAEAALKAVVDKLHRDAGPKPSADKTTRARPMSVLMARVLTGVPARLAAVQGARLPGMSRPHLLH